MMRYGGALFFAVALMLTGCSQAETSAGSEPLLSEPPTEETLFLRGVILVPGGGPNQAPSVCVADKGFSDFAGGTQISVLDAEGNIVAVSELVDGYSTIGGGYRSGCAFKFEIGNIPAGRGFYSLDVGNAFRGIYTVPEGETGKYISIKMG